MGLTRYQINMYHRDMETVVHNVRELSGQQRSAAEQLVGHALRESQQIQIQIVNLDAASAEPSRLPGDERLPDWCNVYEGLTDEEVAGLERAIAQRLDLGRATP